MWACTNKDLSPKIKVISEGAVGEGEGHEGDGSGGEGEGRKGEGSGGDAVGEDNEGSGGEDGEGSGGEGEGSGGEGEDEDEGEDSEGSENEGEGGEGGGEGSGGAKGDGKSESDGVNKGKGGAGAKAKDGKVGEIPDDFALGFQDPSANESAKGGGVGGHHNLGDKKVFQEALLQELLNPTKLVDSNQALSIATTRNFEKNKKNEQVWRPYDPSLDRVVRPTGSPEYANNMRNDIRLLTASLKVEFRRKFLLNKDPKVIHGVPRGRDLSEERLVESFVEILSKVPPSRPDYRVQEALQESLAVAVVGDESGSMQNGQRSYYAASAMMALAEAFDSLRSPIMCCGVRDGVRGSAHHTDVAMTGEPLKQKYHRMDGVFIDLFKDWDEPFSMCRNRFAAYTAQGSTPLGDGMHFGLQALATRQEKYRIMLVLTDGVPNNVSVVNRLNRIALEAGVHVIGIGLDRRDMNVTKVFPKSLIVSDITSLSRLLLDLIRQIVFPKKAERIRLDRS